ncbi:TonB-dependent receptor [Chitinispirillales bacterium ANBcel5]|uniref:TonB-dependent receptor domain-containing protein n=1 Tax=Cellulosispirillum alkaliphilum TaxID=3039283 RepID=UPI002A554A93|nr:TonB-dependent receptor [Chitinispirillales bacterium ANBcel5]
MLRPLHALLFLMLITPVQVTVAEQPGEQAVEVELSSPPGDTTLASQEENETESLEQSSSTKQEPVDAHAEYDELEIEFDDEIELDLEYDASEEQVEEAFGLEKEPELINFTEAHYPEELLREGVEGTVVLELLVDENGAVESVTVVDGVHPQLDSSALKAAVDFTFSPAIANGEPVAVMLYYEYHFSLRDVAVMPEEYVNFSGRLLERGTRTPIPDAFVVLTFSDSLEDPSLNVPLEFYIQQIGAIEGQYLEEDRLVTVTDSNGTFSFRSLPSVSFEISIPVSGYREFSQSEQIEPGEAIEATYYLTRQSYSDFEVTVYGRREEQEVSRRQLSLSEVRRLPGFGGDAVKVVQALPGVARPSYGLGEIVVRGAPTWDTRYYLDGVPIPILYHLSGNSIYNSDALAAVDFYPGGYGTRYGGGIGGAIEITGRKAKTDRFHGVVDVSSLDGNLFVEGPVNERVSFLTSIRRSFIGYLLDYVYKNTEQDLPLTMVPHYWDYLLRTDININDKSDLFITGFGSRDHLVMMVPDMADFGSDEIDEATDRLGVLYEFHMGLIGWDYSITENMSNSLRLSFKTGVTDFSILGLVKVEEDYRWLTLRDELRLKLSDRFTTNIGADVTLVWDDLILNIPDGTGAFQRDTTEWMLYGVAGMYLNTEIRPLENLLIIPGMRYDYYPELDYRGGIVPEFWEYGFMNNNRGRSGEPSFRVNARYEVVPDHTIKAAVGTYNQSPQPMGQVIHETWGDPNLPASKATHYVAGHEWQITDLIHADAQVYYNNQWDIPRMARTEDIQQGLENQKLWISDRKARMYGLELMLRHDQSERFFGWLAYTLSRSEVYDDQRGRYVRGSKDQTHHLQLLGSWTLPKDWGVGFRLRYVTGEPYTPIIGAEESENWNSFIPIYGEATSKRKEPFIGLDLRADKKIVFSTFIMSYYLDLQNISWLFYKPAEDYVYNYNYTQRDEISMFPMLAAGVKFEF